MNKIKSYFIIGAIALVCCLLFTLAIVAPVSAQVEGPHEIRWVRVGSLHSWYSNSGIEIEYGRRTRNHLEDQTDGLRWPAEFMYQDHIASRGMWIGTTNYDDPVAEKSYPYKVLANGPRVANMLHYFMPVEFKMVGRFASPIVTVDGLMASDNSLLDMVDEFDESIPADRLIINKLNSSMGITVTRKVYAFSQQNHDNYFIYEYVFKNTGIIDTKGTQVEKTLTEVIFHFQNRYSYGFEGFRRGGGWGVSGNISWGRNCVNDVVGLDPTASDFEFRAQYSWYGPHSASPGGLEADWGAPNHIVGGMLSAPAMAGMVVLHADKSPGDQSDDLYQPTSTQFVGSDKADNGTDQYNNDLMTRQYEIMSSGHPEKTHAEEVGDGAADSYGNDAGGYSQGQSFGPYTMAPGDSIRIVLAEGVGGLDRRSSMEIGKNWFDGNTNLPLPDGGTTNDANAYKKAWVLTGKDSLFQAFRRAIDNYNSDYNIPQAPPPPDEFTVTSGGNQITLVWSTSAETWPNFDGYKIFRALGQPDTLYDEIFSCDGDNSVNTFADETARRGFNYYYYIQTKDDGSTNDVAPGVPLMSSKFYTMTNEAAYLRKPAVEATYDSIRVVPNPYHIRAQALQFGKGDAADRLAFFGLPKECTIKIFTERGDLIETIEHADGTSDEVWNSTTSSGQVIVSGLYIALFQMPDGQSVFRKFVVIR